MEWHKLKLAWVLLDVTGEWCHTTSEGWHRKPQSYQDWRNHKKLSLDSLPGVGRWVGGGDLIFREDHKVSTKTQICCIFTFVQPQWIPARLPLWIWRFPTPWSTYKWIIYEHKSEHSEFYSSPLISEHLLMPDVLANILEIHCII